jgi:hypothetical protein
MMPPIKEEDSMEEFFSPSTRLELLRFRHWEEWFAEVAGESIGARPAIPDSVLPRWHERSALRAGAATEAQDAGVAPALITDFLTQAHKTSTEQYRRRHERGNAEIAQARLELRKAAEGGGNCEPK